MDRHYLLDKFEEIYKKYNLPENEYKTFAEALGGKKEPVDVENASIVLICFDIVNVAFEDDDLNLHVSKNVNKIFKVIPTKEKLRNDIGDQYRGHHQQMECFTYSTQCEISLPLVCKVAEWIATDKLYRWVDNQSAICLKSIDVLQSTPKSTKNTEKAK
jgi:hypothetical protein